ncbi:MAG: CoA transferase [Hyphomonas sp.]|uniref:Succinyl-CoA:(R)-citramalate CoA-transferase n=1 Tax=Hyphomonas oceanitis SCH89 TaxID=1280953 RepID=A0A059G478_9PROT|nr:CoA transferase [Hyphomonas oceanitis]KDA01662.1 succinyl-CoA:(R)-citramalate CoA-transferase [Hyphomonas oceanitis SCH89]|tara:strand:+ start:392 stop:1558 length:1167 start_codon:yes stop_codon:yes gene_type:complete
MTDTPKTNGPLHGLRVVEMGQLIAGPFCGQLLGDMGAEVVKIEPPGKGDPMREWGQGDKPAWWRVIGRNKYSVAVDLRTEEGQELARDLIGEADVLVENFRPGALEKWGLDPLKLRETNQGLIVARMSGYGQTGPYADRPGFGLIGEGFGGLRGITGEPDRMPSRVGISIGDTLAASYGAMGILAALHHRDKTGDGQIIDVALYESVLQVMESYVADYSTSGFMRQRTGAILPKIAPSNVYPCKDGEFLIGANQDPIFRRLCDAMGQPELATDARYATHLARGEHQAELDGIISDWTRTLTVAELEKLLLKNAVPSGKIYTAADMVSDPHYAAREAIVTVDDPELGPVKMQNTFPKFSATPGSIRKQAPRSVGEDTAAVLERWLGRPA